GRSARGRSCQGDALFFRSDRRGDHWQGRGDHPRNCEPIRRAGARRPEGDDQRGGRAQCDDRGHAPAGGPCTAAHHGARQGHRGRKSDSHLAVDHSLRSRARDSAKLVRRTAVARIVVCAAMDQWTAIQWLHVPAGAAFRVLDLLLVAARARRSPAAEYAEPHARAGRLPGDQTTRWWLLMFGSGGTVPARDMGEIQSTRYDLRDEVVGRAILRRDGHQMRLRPGARS
ncbi:hypothetical protein Ctob_015379, partial [Chrysochromulina tobinii]